MSNFEDPLQFDTKKKVGDVELMYSDLMEISQGGPEVGKLSINGIMIDGYYGGPSILRENYIYVPALMKKFFGSGFKLARINTVTLKVEYLSKLKDLIFLDKIIDNRIYFFEDMSRTIQKYQNL